MSEFSIRSMKQLLKIHTTKRVGEDAATELGNMVEQYGLEIAEKAQEIAEKDGRMTVRESDIVEAMDERRRIVVEEEVNL